MQIEFAAGDAGYFEAHALLQIVRHAQTQDPVASAEVQLLDALRAAAEAAIARPEFGALRERVPDVAEPPAQDTGWMGWWRAVCGPSRREQMLSAQRIAALERAQRAEHSAFEALAETARVARERDTALARLAACEAARGDAGEQARVT